MWEHYKVKNQSLQINPMNLRQSFSITITSKLAKEIHCFIHSPCFLSLGSERCFPKGHPFKARHHNEPCLPSKLSQTLASQSLTLQKFSN